ncbi:MAG: zinc metalloprotease HtpX [Deferribacteres bacterium]|nr:zinc metalloprotease HtpX [candidate division KSB1 bacterium]MCB9509881.1 zinc metalloprotease HtpX [Deferribacteres bacterium]
MNTLKTTILMAGLTALFLVIGNAIGGQGGMMIAFVFAIGMNVFSYWFSDRIVLRMYKAQEVGPSDGTGLYSLVNELSVRAGLPMPKVYVIPGDQPNAFATGRNPQNSAVAFTEGIMHMMDREELSGVIAHELAHIKNRDILISTIAATFAGAITMLANMAQWAMIFGGMQGDDEDEGGGLIGTLLMAILAPIAAMLIQMAISRSREYLADAEGARISGNPSYLARALRKLQYGTERIPMHASPATSHLFIANPLRGGGFVNLFSTHPPMDERIERLEKMALSRSHYA